MPGVTSPRSSKRPKPSCGSPHLRRLLDDGTPVTVPGLKAFVVNLLERVKVLVDQVPRIGRLRTRVDGRGAPV